MKNSFLSIILALVVVIAGIVSTTETDNSYVVTSENERRISNNILTDEQLWPNSIFISPTFNNDRILGTWLIEESELTYIFNADGTGYRLVDGNKETFEWAVILDYTKNVSVLVLSLDDDAENIEEWHLLFYQDEMAMDKPAISLNVYRVE